MASKGYTADEIRSSGFGPRSIIKAGKHEGVTRRPAESYSMDGYGGKSKLTPEDFRKMREEKEQERRRIETEQRNKMAGITTEGSEVK